MKNLVACGLLACAFPTAACASATTPATSTITPAQLAGQAAGTAHARREAIASSIAQQVISNAGAALCGSEASLTAGLNVALEDLVGRDPALTPLRAAELRRRLRAAGPKLAEVCDLVMGAALRGDAGPLESLREAVRGSIDTMSEQELEGLGDFLDSPAGDALRKLEASTARSGSELLGRWFATVGLSVYGDILAAVRADLDPAPAAAGAAGAAPAITGARPAAGNVLGSPAAGARPAQLRNRDDLGAACWSFYPARSRMLGEEGKVTLLLYIAEDGHLASVVVETSSGYPALDIAAAACVGAAARFEPQQRDGHPVATWQRLRWSWALTE